MIEEQIECLEKSINEKWIPIVEGRHEENSCYDCACCQFATKYDDLINCGKCPIGQDIGWSCGEDGGENISSYYIFADLRSDFNHACFLGDNYDLMFDLKAAAQMELDYLIDLRDRLKGRLYEMEQIEDARPGPGKL